VARIRAGAEPPEIGQPRLILRLWKQFRGGLQRNCNIRVRESPFFIDNPFQEIFMRAFLATSAIAFGLTACASQAPAPAKPAAAPAQAVAAAPKAPQCWNGDAGQFMDVGTKTSISGVAVACEKTSDGKSAQWMGAKH
jgi:hypothetical protein